MNARSAPTTLFVRLLGRVTAVRRVGTRGVGAIFGAAILVLVGSCGVPTDDGVRTIDPAEIPSGLIEPPSVSEVPPTPLDGESTPEVYFLGEGEILVKAPRKLGNGQPPRMLSAVLEELSEGPNPAELEDGLSSALPPDLDLELVELVDGRATVELIGEQVPASANLSTLAVGQIVLSATSVPTVSSVLLARDGVRIEAPLGDGALSRQPLTAEQYQNLLTSEQ